jgi:hypothetical protein
MKHKYYDVIKAFAKGKTIQGKSKFSKNWIDYMWYKFPDFNNEELDFRIKPEIVIQKQKKLIYRVALMKFEFSGRFYTATKDMNYISCEEFEKSSNDFVEWITDWIEYEIKE